MQRTISLAVLACALFLLAVLTLTVGRPATAAAAPKDGDDSGPTAAATFEVYKDKGGEFRWRLRTQNTKVIASSGEGYAEKRACMAAIDSVKRDAPKAAVKEVEDGQ
jgi:uncharacterized protein